MAKQKAHFGPELFAFLRTLKKNNKREWFHKNKARYERDVKEPMLQFIIDFGAHLKKISRAYNADPRPVGGSLFRIYRDVRFGKDKSPYKTTAGAHFRHDVGKDAHAPGFYLHMEPGSVFVASGVWHPDGPALAKIRHAIVDNDKAWQRIVSSKVITACGGIEGDSLKRPPRGFDAEHPLVEDLKRKDFFVVKRLSEKAACQPGFIDSFAKSCREFAPLTKFLTEALELRW